MTELAVVNGHAPATVQPAAPARVVQNAAVGDLIAWAESARAAANIAESLAKTSFVPKDFRGKPAEITAAILVGQEIGLSPMAALRSIHMVHGTPGLSANALVGIAQANGHQVWVESETAVMAVVCGIRAGTDKVQRAEWTIARAQQAGLPEKNPNWRSQPQNMLVARAKSQIARLVAADALLGMPYSLEELSDEEAVAPAVAARKVSRRKQPPAVALPEPELTPPTGDEATESGEDDEFPQPAAASPARNGQPAAPAVNGSPDPHLWDIHQIAASIGMSEADLEAHCHGVTGGPIAEASEAQIRALTQELANEMVAQDNRARSAQ